MKQVDKDAYAKDIQRSIRNGKRRFISLLLIVALGVMMFSALKSACEDLRYSADHFFDQQNLRDIEIVSTLGLTQEDVDAVCTVRGVEKAEGIHSETVDFKAGEEKSTATLCTLTDSGINTPYLLEGSMPETNTQVLITRKLAETCGIQVGDSILLQNAANQQDEKEEAPLDSLESISEQDAGSAAYQTDELTVVGIATDVRDVNNPFGSVSYRTTDLESEVIFVLPSLISVDYYTAVEVRVSGTEAYNCYSQEYMSAVQEV
jgi:putative ABC transport system permease protein